MRAKLNIRTAALPPDVRIRVSIAASLLPGRGIAATVGEWDGTRCDLLIVHGADAYGRDAAAAARRRGARVLLLDKPAKSAASGDHHLQDDASPSLLLRVIEGALLDQPSTATAEGAPSARPNDPAKHQVCGIVGYVDAAAVNGGDLIGQHGSISVLIRGGTSRIFAPEYSTILRARERIGSAGWSFAPVTAREVQAAATQTSRSLDAFFIVGAMQSPSLLPNLPDVRYHLDAWPDLADIGSLVSPLRMAAHLVSKAATRDELAVVGGVDSRIANAFLWACKTGGLLSVLRETTKASESKATPAIPAMADNILQRLARRFGLTA